MKHTIFNKKKEEQILLGSILGDGCIYKNKNNNYKYSESHSLKQKEYVLWKNRFLKFNIHTYNDYNSFSKNIEKIYISKGDTKRFSKFYELFYPNGKKVVTKEIINMLESLGLAVWHMDDGSYDYNNNRINIYSNGFSLKENIILQGWFKEKFNIKCKILIHNQNKKYNLRFNRTNSNKLIQVIKPHIISSMKYKIGLDKERKHKSRVKKNEWSRKWTRNNKAKSREIKSNWELKNKEKSKRMKREWRLKNPNYMKEYRKKIKNATRNN